VQPVAPPNKRAFRYKIALLIAIVVAVAFAWNAGRKANTPTTAPVRVATPAAAPRAAAPQAAAKPAEPVPNAYAVDTPPALATTLAATELDVHGAGTVCVRVDGAAAAADTLAALARPGLKLDCTDAAALTLDVRGYRTDGSGTGTVELAVTSATDGGTPTTQVRTLLVRRREAEWRVLRVLSVR
jgi:hypothetical protein